MDDSALQPSNGDHGGEAAADRAEVLSLVIPRDVVESVAARAAELLEARRVSEVEPWIAVGDAAAHLACPRSRIYALVSARRIPHRKDGSRLLFRRSDLDAWLADGGGVRP
ncbi:MAG: helix-turn-helix domain-containing protein [Thermoleophilaceae bacterium]